MHSASLTRRFSVWLIDVSRLTMQLQTFRWVRLFFLTWWLNKKRILTLAVVNTALTIFNEAVFRTISTSPGSEYAFLVQSASGLSIHRQSLINICMTIFASLFAGPVYFLATMRSRFLFFVSFGVFNSFVSQGVTSMFLGGNTPLIWQRLTFDLFYNGSFKFLIFELGRDKLAHAKTKLRWIGSLRLGQDFLLAAIKISILNFFHFK